MDTEELERLRRRAYGPDADIAGDAAAQTRLAQLEAARRRQLGGGDTAADAASPVRERGPGAESPDGAVGNGIDGPPWWRHRRWLAVLGAAVVALALTAGYAAGATRLLSPTPTPLSNESPMPTMPPVPDGFPQGLYLSMPHEILELTSIGAVVDRPNDRHRVLSSLGIRSDELRRYEDFDGLNVWTGESRYGMTCLFVAVPVQGIREGYSTEGCAPDGFTTMAELPRYGSSTVVRFVLRDGDVGVYVYERSVDPRVSDR